MDNRSFEDSAMKSVEDDGSGRKLILFLLGVFLVGCGLLFALAFLYFQPDALALVDRYFPSATASRTATPKPTSTATPSPTLTPTRTITPTATTTLTPHVLITPALDETVFNETFASNESKWYGYYNGSQVTVTDGRLILSSEKMGFVAVAFCTNCPNLGELFYYQAEISTVAAAAEFYGLAFCSPGYGPDFYLFQINPALGQYEVYKHSATGWETLITAQYSSSINDFPVTNTLGLYFDHGSMDLFINNTQVNSYEDKNPLECKKSGFYVNNGDFEMIADNLFAYAVKPTPTATP
jgi:hypothetical protein